MLSVVIWGQMILGGRTISIALVLGIPFLDTEAWGAGRIATGIWSCVVSLMRNWRKRRDSGAQNTDERMSAGANGFPILKSAPHDRFVTGEHSR